METLKEIKGKSQRSKEWRSGELLQEVVWTQHGEEKISGTEGTSVGTPQTEMYKGKIMYTE